MLLRMPPALRMLVLVLLTTLPRSARAWPEWGVSGGVATVRGAASQGTWQSWSPMVTADVVFRGGWTEVFAGAAATALVGPTADGGMAPLSALGMEVGAGVGVPLLSVGVYGGWGWPGGTVGLYGRMTLPASTEWADRIGIEGRLLATTADAATGGALLLRVEPAPLRRTAAPERPQGLDRSAEGSAAPGPADVPAPDAPTPTTSEPSSSDAGPGHHDDPYER
jgi:hypothetical protein